MTSALPAKPVVYVVDDNPGVLGSLRFLLETDGFEVETFRSGLALLKSVASNQADCFVIDCKMPDIHGIDLANRLRSRDITAPIILITGSDDDNIPAKAAVVGGHYVLLNPALGDTLVPCIRAAIQQASPVADLSAGNALR